MAKVTTSTQQVEKVVRQAVEEKRYLLDLSEAEARLVRTVTGNIAGEVQDSPRKYADSVYSSLTRAGVPTFHYTSYSGVMTFKTGNLLD